MLSYVIIVTLLMYMNSAHSCELRVVVTFLKRKSSIQLYFKTFLAMPYLRGKRNLCSFCNSVFRGSTFFFCSKDTTQTAQIIPNAPRNPVVTNLNSLLSDIYVRYIQLKPDDFRLHYRVFDSIFQDLHKKMKEVDLYYGRYSSTVSMSTCNELKMLFYW